MGKGEQHKIKAQKGSKTEATNDVVNKHESSGPKNQKSWPKQKKKKKKSNETIG